MMAPVEVPPTNEKMSRVSWPVVLSSLARTTAGIMPRMPPPSIDNRYRRGTSPPFHPLFRGLARPQKYATNGRSAHPHFSPKGLAPRALISPLTAFERTRCTVRFRAGLLRVNAHYGLTAKTVASFLDVHIVPLLCDFSVIFMV